jgi:CRISPR-associated protein Csd1
MILTALYALYQRRMADPDPLRRLPIYGFEEKGIPYILDIDHNGTLINLRSTLSNDKKPVAQQFLVPQGVKKAAGVAANLLWDNLEYVLGVDARGKPERVIEQHAAFRARIRALPEAAQQDAGIIAVNRFLDQFTLDQVTSDPAWEQIFAANPLMTFQLHGDLDLICQRAAVADVSGPSADSLAAEQQGVCLITGEDGPIERLHTAIKGVWGAQSSGANIVSFNANAYCSFGNNGKQGANAPVSKKAVFGYTTALNALLTKDSGQRVQVGDASTVFWAEKPHDLETAIPDAFGEPPKDRPDAGAEAVKRLYAWVANGKAVALEGGTRFYVLGLAPNAARISVRFWESLPLRDLALRTVRHFDDLKIARAPFDPEYPSLFRLLAACAAQGKADNIPPNLGGDVIRSVLGGGPYPATWLAAAIRRCRAEQNINYLRAAVIKACLNRRIRQTNAANFTSRKELTVMLDPANQTTGYCLGRLFATLERLQEESANPNRDPNSKLNATIRDRYFGAAGSSPLMVFTTLMRLHHHHLSKLQKFSTKSYGTYVFLDKLITEIMQKIGQFPAHMALEEQGFFCIGYYHQRQEFFPKSTPSAE